MAWVLKMEDATIESGLVHDFDASLSGIGQELGAGAYSMRLETVNELEPQQLPNHITGSIGRPTRCVRLRFCVVRFVQAVMASVCFGIYSKEVTAGC